MKTLFIFCLLISAKAFAYPEMTRHGYANCTACHLSPNGGGVLTPYGRELSKEVLSKWSGENEHLFAYGLIKTSDKILLGGFVRGLQYMRNDPIINSAHTILMHADFEAAYNAETWAIDASIGRQEIGGVSNQGRVFSRRHYLMKRFGDHSIRIGKFFKTFGLGDPNHNLYTRKHLNFGFDTETYNFEYAYLGQDFAVYADYIYGSIPADDIYAPNKERGGAVTLSYFFNEKQKVGFSFYGGENDSNKKYVGGPWAVVAISSKFYLLSEVFLQSKITKRTDIGVVGGVTSHRLNYEWT